MRKIYQLLAGASVGDAITNYAFEIRDICIDSGLLSEIYSEKKHIAPIYLSNQSVKDMNFIKDHIKNEDILIYHYSIGSQATELFRNINCQKMLCYHNVTPAKYFFNLNQKQSQALREGRDMLSSLVNNVRVACAVSEYNEKELKELRFPDTEKLPLMVPTDYLNQTVNEQLIKMYDDQNLNMLFVGRIVPNKNFEALIKTFAYFQSIITEKARLFLVGSYIGNEKYYSYLKILVNKLSLNDKVIFSGFVDTKDLISYYKLSDIFLCLSEHEGFGLPLIESMYFDLPVFALDRAAVSETLGGAGVLINDIDYVKICELINAIITDDDLTEKIINHQRERLNYFNYASLKGSLSSIFSTYFDFKL